MPKGYSDDLYELIRSLNTSEKAFFKTFASKLRTNGVKNYIKLFDAVSRQKEYNEKKIIRRFQRERFIRHLPRVKHYLYELVLKSLHNHHIDTGADAQLKKMIHYADIVGDKGLYFQSFKMLRKAEELAEKYEKYVPALDIINSQKKLLPLMQGLIRHGRKISVLNREEIFKRELSLLDKIKRQSEYWIHSSRIFSLSRQIGSVRTGKELKQIEEIINSPMFQKPDEDATFQSRFYYYNVHALYYRMKGDNKNCYNYRRQLVALMEKYPEQIEDEPNNYIAALNNLLIILNTMLGEKNSPALEKEFMQTIQKLRNIKSKSQETEVKVFLQSYNLELVRYLVTGQFESGRKLVPEIETGFEKFKGKIGKPQELDFYYNIACLFFGLKDYSSAVQWLNKLINDKEAGVKKDLIAIARILNLLFHFELGNNDLLEHVVRSTYLFLLKRKRLYKFETVVLNFIRKEMPKITSRSELLNAFRRLKEQVIQLSKDPYEERALDYFDFVSWLESKIENRPFADIVREKAVRG